MIIISEPAVKNGTRLSQQLMYNNALAVFGLVPMLALCSIYYKQGDFYKMNYCKNALVDFANKSDSKLRGITTKNLGVINGNRPVMENDIHVFDVAFKELGYYEKYNELRLQSEVQELINFLDIGV